VVANIGRDELKAKMDGGDHVVLLEVLASRYYRHSHLPGALNLPPGKAAEMAPHLLPDKEAEIVLYCWDTAWPTSLQAARELAAMGYANVREYGEGKKAWIAAGLPVEGRSRRHRKWGWWGCGRIDAYYDTRIGPRCTMGRAEVLEASLHLGTGGGAGTRVVLKVPPDSQQPKRPMYSTLVGFSKIAYWYPTISIERYG
jgi:rhodanese-related sulfurtransferase